MTFEAEPDDLDDEEPTWPSWTSARARVLIAEDDAGLRELIVTRLQREGFDIVEAGSGSETLDVLSLAAKNGSDELDLIVIDQRMPGFTGLEIIRMMRAAAWSVPVVLITAFPDRLLLAEASALDVIVVPKPFQMDLLSAAAIEVLLDHIHTTSEVSRGVCS